MRAGSRQNNTSGDRQGAGIPAFRGPTTHVIVLDGTLSSLAPLHQTNAARTYMLLKEVGTAVSLYYEAGLQWDDWRSVLDVASGKGINRLIRRTYGWLASRYRPGDRIFLFGYSRGAYAVRSLAGVIDRVGLLRAEHATPRNIRLAYRHYECSPAEATKASFHAAYCHDTIEIEMIGVWDTVKSLGINAPVLWRLSEHLHAFHNHDLSHGVRNGFHALAHDETRVAFSPVLWECRSGFEGRVEQVWFPGAHGDVGGQLGGFEAARPLANIPLVWMLEQAEFCGLPLPPDWRARYVQDATAPARGTWRGHGRVLMSRRKRIVGQDPSERLHESIAQRQAAQTSGTTSVPQTDQAGTGTI
ncbi:DUF2235 domain-containing protein [Sulfitobacter sp. M57]|uniref:DUF2235 domain-containing protein n=1 Tax=unclassified Sulfitobacter TaxID=196795 RepID=UPI0023E3252D|nr:MULTISPECIES: DUF2235 domain-containing protein [unclassified Sulfitobacter]MDF3413056.1 DUF2235 domain-containing protein [Sulfitobacter sp. KE5]MDF3421660.1 DUF2235 domain-containing protein [Sulfitobacter sp. KE43]MDF3431605.1 DUF2235 domain-containing protein [Sulfitobacter sp. KE42]MDF3457246.1 DUF2235 domain-containing protein [Sulfitobacter sp. S74]MDF3461149.1 DUF2235 domain-containing protein [Sulfitobacter sp. Ks18]